MALVFADFEFDLVRRELKCKGARLKVDAKLLQLLAYFLANPGRLIGKRELLDRVWEGRAVADNVLSVSVAKLRKVLGHAAATNEFIENCYGRGYRFVREVTTLDAPMVHASSVPPSASAPRSPLVGRAAPLQRLDAALQRARAGFGRICLLSGEPGIGKTRLAEVIEQRALACGVNVAWGRCQAAEGTPPLWPFIQVLRELAGAGVIDAASAANVEAWVGQGRAEPASMLSHSDLVDAVRAGHGLIDALLQVLCATSKKTPLLIIIDDMQWADAASLKLLCSLVGEISRWPLFVVLTQRSTRASPEPRAERGLLRLYAHTNCERIELERLPHTEVDAYVNHVFGIAGSSLGAAVFERSEGNPFFMVELLRPWLGLAPPGPQQLQVTGAALDLVRERVQNLPELSLEVLSAAAVIGQTFDLGLLSHVTERPAHELLEALDDSLANDTIVPSAEWVGAYAFDHALIREVLYDELPLRKRSLLHARAGEGLARRRDAGGEVRSAELARHFLAALPHGDLVVALGHARVAAASATIMCAHADARALLRRALASLRFALEPLPEIQTALLLELAIVERALADPAYNEHLQQGVALARGLRLGSMLTLAGRFLSPGPGTLTKADAHNVLEAAIEVLPPEAESERALVLAQLSWTPPSSWSARKVESLLAQAKQLAQRSGNSEALAAVRDAELHASALPTTRDRADALAAEVDRELARKPTRVGLWRAIYTPIYRLISATHRGDQVAVERAIAEMTTLHDKLNIAELYWHHERLLVIQRMSRGEWSGVSSELDRLREQAERMRFQAWRGVSACDYGWFLLNTGDPHGLARRMRPYLAPVSYDSPNTRSLKLRSLAEHGFLEDAREGLAELSPEAVRDLPHDRDCMAVFADLSVVSVAVGSLEHCRVLYEQLCPYADYYAMGVSFHCQGSLSHYLGNLARALGDSSQALAWLERGVEQNRRFGLTTWVVHNQLDLAKLLLAPGPVHAAARGRQLSEAVAQQAAKLGMHAVEQAALRLSAAPILSFR